VNEETETIHPVVLNPHTLLSLIPPTTRAFTCLDLKDDFFCLQLVEARQPLFAFKWEDPGTGAKGQLTWTRSPQGFKKSPTIFGEALARDLENCQLKYGTILQNVDDILLAAPTLEACKNGTEELLQFLQEAGYKVLQKKAQICLEEVMYLGYHLSQGKRRLGTGRKEVTHQYPCRDSSGSFWAPQASAAYGSLDSQTLLGSTKGEPHRTIAMGS
jgi:hypothetical protein